MGITASAPSRRVMDLRIVAIVGAVVFLFVLIQFHLYASRRVWEPVFEEELDVDPDGEPDEPPTGPDDG